MGSPVTTESAETTLRDLLQRRAVRSLLISQSAASSASVGLAITMGVFVFELTGREAHIGYVGFAEFLPTFALVLWAGSLADRFDRRRLAATAFVAQAVVAFTIAWYVTTDEVSIWPLLGLTTAFGVARGFASPAARALPTNVVAEHELPRLVPVLSTTWQLSMALAPLVIGAVYGIGAAWTFVAIGVLSLTAAGSVLTVELFAAQQRTGRATFGQALQGLRLVVTTPLLLAAIGLDLFAVLLGGVVALAPAIASELLDAPDGAAFWIRSAGGVGAVATAAVLAWRPIERRVGQALLQSVAVFGLITVAVAFSPSLVLTLVLFAGLAAADMVSVFVRATIVPLATPDSLRGRVLAVEAVFIGASNELGAFESGLVAEWFGLAPAIVISGVAVLVVVGAFTVAVPDLRRLDRFAEIRHDHHR